MKICFRFLTFAFLSFFRSFSFSFLPFLFVFSLFLNIFSYNTLWSQFPLPHLLLGLPYLLPMHLQTVFPSHFRNQAKKSKLMRNTNTWKKTWNHKSKYTTRRLVIYISNPKQSNLRPKEKSPKVSLSRVGRMGSPRCCLYTQWDFMEKTDFSFACGCQLKIASWLGMGAVRYLISVLAPHLT